MKDRRKQKCAWTLSDEFEPQYETTCGNAFEFNSDGPSENSFKYCPYCGKLITEATK